MPEPRLGLAVKPNPVQSQHWVWHSRYGTIVIAVQGDEVFVNGDRVQRHAP